MESKRLQEARDFLQELAEHPPTLPYEPTLLPRLFAATKEDSTASIDDLTALIERSQKLATRVLAIANSAVYALEATVTSVHRAISILGFREVRNMVITVAAVSAIKGAKLPKDFNAVGLWRHQLTAATIARTLCAALREQGRSKGGPGAQAMLMAPDEAYAAALLHDIGKVFLAASRPAIWTAIEQIRAEQKLRVFEAEDAYWSMDHALVGAQVLHYWKLPLLLTDSINWHHAPELAPAFKEEAKLLCAADHIAHAGLTKTRALPPEVMHLLPADTDAAAFGGIVHTALHMSGAETLMGLVG
ncbi:HDOD domain-containing protein [Desulfovibrio sp. OttesenSCG-928-A18]|nr:HDOD domain-containing protein [Desulfovibrio sp. OttesenSCG-928-A18]